MPQSEMFSVEDIAIIQTRQLRKTIHYVYQRSPYYRDLMDQAGLQPADIKTLEDLRLLPTLSQAELIRESHRVLCVRPEDVVENFFLTPSDPSGGLFYAADADLARMAYSGQLSLKIAGMVPKDRVALGLPLEPCTHGGLAYYMGLQRLGAGINRLGLLEPGEFLNAVSHLQSTVIIASMDFMQQVTQHAQVRGDHLPDGSVRRILVVNEPLRLPDFKLAATGAALEQAWNAQVGMSYHWAELLGMLCECEAGRGCHLHPELMHIEILNPQGKETLSGQPGEACLTVFGVSGMPLIRYRLGQRALIDPAPCLCGRVTPRLVPLAG